jgi:hypothetical protein
LSEFNLANPDDLRNVCFCSALGFTDEVAGIPARGVARLVDALGRLVLIGSLLAIGLAARAERLAVRALTAAPTVATL